MHNIAVVSDMQNAIQTKTDEVGPRKRYTKQNEQEDFDLLKQLYGKNKKLPRGYELQALLALSHYPELKDIAIEFRFVQGNGPLSAQPSKPGLLRSGEKRTYIINISKKAKSTLQPVLLRNLTFNQQVAAIGHELGHVLDYMGKTSLHLVGIGVFYFIDSFKRKLESRTDVIAIKHGLGHQILDYSELVAELKKIHPDEKYYRTYHLYYLTPGEIREKMRRLKMYS